MKQKLFPMRFSHNCRISFITIGTRWVFHSSQVVHIDTLRKKIVAMTIRAKVCCIKNGSNLPISCFERWNVNRIRYSIALNELLWLGLITLYSVPAMYAIPFKLEKDFLNWMSQYHAEHRIWVGKRVDKNIGPSEIDNSVKSSINKSFRWFLFVQ